MYSRSVCGKKQDDLFMSYSDNEILSIPFVIGGDVKEQLLTISESAGQLSLHLRSLKKWPGVPRRC